MLIAAEKFDVMHNWSDPHCKRLLLNSIRALLHMLSRNESSLLALLRMQSRTIFLEARLRCKAIQLLLLKCSACFALMARFRTCVILAIDKVVCSTGLH